MTRPPIAPLLTALCAGLGAAPAVPFGIHGPSYSHMIAAGAPETWTRGQSIFDAFHQLGVDWARMDIWWSVVEPAPGQWDWEAMDRALRSYAENDIALMAILCYGSAWDGGRAPVTDAGREDFGRYVYETVRRHRAAVHEWEIWNEPNILPFWAPKPDAADYAALLRVAFAQAKAADPGCTVIGGATAGADLDFVREIFEHGAGDAFDVLSYHSYGNRPTREALEAEARGLREILAEHGRADAPLWLSEHGIFTGPGGVAERDQARDIVRSALWRLNAGVERVMYLSLRDWHGTEEATGRDFWGFLTSTGEPKESFYALRTLAHAIRERPLAGEVHLGPGVEAFLFGGTHDNALAIWSTEGSREVTLDAGTTHLLTQSLLGEERLLSSEGRVFTLALSPDPLWLHSVGDNLLLLARTRTPPVTLARGAAAETEVTIENPLEHALQISVSAEAPEGLQVIGLPTEILLGAKTRGSLRFSLQAAQDAPVGPLDLPLTLAAHGPALPIGAAVHHVSVEIAEPFTVTALAAQRLTAEGEYPLRFEVTNHTADLLAVEARCQVSGLAPMTAATEVAQRGEIAFQLPLSPPSSPPAGEGVWATRATASVEISAAGHTVTLGEALRLFPIPRLAHPVAIDADLSEWTGPPTLASPEFTEVDFNPNLTRGPADIAARGWLAWSEEGLHLAIEITDDVIALPPDRMIWDFDGLQFALDTRHDARGLEGFDDDDIEIEIGLLTDGSVLVFTGHYPPGRVEEVVPRESQVAVSARGNRLTYEALLPAAVLDPMTFEPGALFGFNLIQNDNDGAGREGWLELAPGIGWGKEPAQYPTGILLPARPSPFPPAGEGSGG